MDHLLRRVLKRLKPSDKDVGQEKQPFGTGIMLIEAPENLLGQDFTENSTAQIDSLMVGGNRLFVDEVCSIDEKAVDCNKGTVRSRMWLEPTSKIARQIL
jgi:hypothetical protein